MVQGNMDSVAIQVELMEAVCKLSGHGTLGQKGGMPECRNPCEKTEMKFLVFISYIFSQCLKKG